MKILILSEDKATGQALQRTLKALADVNSEWERIDLFFNINPDDWNCIVIIDATGGFPEQRMAPPENVYKKLKRVSQKTVIIWLGIWTLEDRTPKEPDCINAFTQLDKFIEKIRSLPTNKQTRRKTMRKILFIDDNTEWMNSVKRALGRLKDVIFAQCCSVSDAIEAVEKHKPDVIFLDHMLSDGGHEGFGVIRQLDTHHIAVYVNTVIRATEVHMEYMSLGAERSVNKDMSLEEWGELIREVRQPKKPRLKENPNTLFREILSREFIKFEKVARVLALAVASGKNCLLWGPAGHGKSEMTLACIKAIAANQEIFIQSFGEGMDEATLWGGLDFRALEDEKVLRYFPTESFMAKRFAIFEEMFDAPANVLLALKDTLTAKELRKGAQRFSMKTEVIIAITNKDPDEVSDLGPAAHALVERFPLQIKVDWEGHYQAKDYRELFEKVGPFMDGPKINGQGEVLAQIMARCSSQGNIVSPRTAVHALGVVKSAAILDNRDHVQRCDLVDLQLLPGMEEFAGNIDEELRVVGERIEADQTLTQIQSTWKEHQDTVDTTRDPLVALRAVGLMRQLIDELADLTVPEDMNEAKQNLRAKIEALLETANDRAIDLVEPTS